jgi:dihydroflavonol-4-reductase
MITLVTGASGHVGANLVRSLLSQGRKVRVLQHNDHEAFDGLSIEVVHGDICQPESLVSACEGVEVVFHLAAAISIEMGGAEKVEAVNLQGTRNMIEACLSQNVRRMVHFSSIHAFDQSPLSQPLDEGRAPVKTPCPPYDHSKAAGEEAVREAVCRSGLDAVIINPTAIIGPGDYRPSHFGQVILSLARRQLPVLVVGGFDWVDVRDVVQGAMQAELIAPPGAKYLLSGHWASLKEIAGLVTEFSGVAAPRFTSPGWLALAGVPFISAYARLRGKRPLYTRAAIQAVRSNKNISHARASAELGYHSRPLAQTLHDTLIWFHEHGRLPGVNIRP